VIDDPLEVVEDEEDRAPSRERMAKLRDRVVLRGAEGQRNVQRCPHRRGDVRPRSRRGQIAKPDGAHRCHMDRSAPACDARLARPRRAKDGDQTRAVDERAGDLGERSFAADQARELRREVGGMLPGKHSIAARA
jgi:hypothetical protein